MGTLDNESTEQRYITRLKILHEIDKAILTSRRPTEIAATAVTYLKQLVAYERASVLSFDFDIGQATILAAEAPKATELLPGEQIQFTDFNSLSTLQKHQPFIVDDLANIPKLSKSDQILLNEGIHSYIMLPLVSQGELIGSLNMCAKEKDFLNEATLNVIQEITDQVAVAVQQAILFEGDKRSLRESDAIAKISQALNETFDLEEIFQLIAESAWQIIPRADRTVIHILDEIEQILRPITVTRGGDVYHDGLMMRPGEGIAGHVVLKGELINVFDTHSDPRFIAGSRSQHRSLMVAPIKNREGSIGTITVQNPAPRAFNADDERLLIILGTQAALAIKNARLFAAEQNARLVAETMRSTNIALTQTLDLDAVLETLLEYIHRLIPYDSANVMLRQGKDRVVFSASRGYENWVTEPEQFHEMSFETNLSTLKPILAEQKSVIINDTANEPEWSTSVGASHVRSWLGVPLLAGGEVIGLYSLDKVESDFFTIAHRDLAEAFANQASIAIHNALLYKAEREQFRRLQQSQTQLVQAEKMGALGRLVASIAHEINNPIQAMQGCLTLITEELEEPGPEEETVELYLGIVKSELTRVATIVSNMRDFYRPAAAGMDLTNIHEVMESVLKLTGKQLQRSSVELVQIEGNDIPFIKANPSHLRQVFLNLVLNAIDAMQGGGTLRIETTVSNIPVFGQKGGPAVSIRLSDTGAGIPEETVSRLFEPFFTTKEQGSGLGLSISYGIIEAHNGEITVESEEGKGTTFTILLPVDQP